jgi:hypothetical protein
MSDRGDPGRRLRLPASFALAALVTLAGRAPAQDEAPPPPESAEASQSAQPDLLSSVPPLLRPDATRAEREASAAALIAEERFAPLRAALVGEAGENGEAAAAARAAIAKTTGDAALVNLLEEAAIATPGAEGAAAAATLATWSHRDAVRALVRLLREARATDRPLLAQACARGLERITARPCDPRDPSPWHEWWSDAEWLPEADWRRALTTAHRERWLETAAEREALEARVLDLSARLHAELEPGQRTELLAEMLNSSRRAERIGGLRLIERALLNGRVVDPALAPATAELLRDEDPEIRQLAARSLLRFAPEAGSSAASTRLALETDETTAATLLDLAAAGGASAQVAELAEPWLARGNEAIVSAARVIRSAIEQGRSPGEAFERRVREAAASALAASPRPAVVRLLGAVGRSEELDLVAQLLAESPDDAVASACVLALERSAGGLARLENAAQAAPERRALIAESLSRGAGGVSTYGFLIQMPGLEEPTRREAASRAWSRLSDAEAIAATRLTPSPELRVELLESRLNGGPATNGARDGGSDSTSRETLTAMLARALLEADRPADVFATLGRLPGERQAELGGEVAGAAIARLRELGLEPPTPEVCAPALWASAMAHLASRSPEAVIELAEDERFSTYLASDQDAAEAARAVAEAARTRLEAEASAARSAQNEGESQPDQAEDPPNPGDATGSILPASRPETP